MARPTLGEIALALSCADSVKVRFSRYPGDGDTYHRVDSDCWASVGGGVPYTADKFAVKLHSACLDALDIKLTTTVLAWDAE